MKALTGFESCQQSNAANGALHLGLPSLTALTAIPLDYCLCVLDLKDAFFFLPFQKTEKNLLSLYHLQIIRTLDANFMANSPTICQEFVAAAIEPTRHKYPEAYVLHYMDDILVSHPS
jgi:hypothetical protein